MGDSTGHELPPQPPEAKLIDKARRGKIPRLSVRQAAKNAGISEGRWRQIIKGHQAVTKDFATPARAPSDTLAAMAHAVGVTPSELIEVGREDAAESLAAMLRTEEATWDGDLTTVPSSELINELQRRLDTFEDTEDIPDPAAWQEFGLAARRINPRDTSTFTHE